MKTAVIVQARMGSKRFPGKVLADLLGKPVLWHVLTRARKITADYHLLAAVTSDQQMFQPIAREAGFVGVYWGGGENDVLSRFHYAASAPMDVNVVVRVTGDCPLIDAEECNRIVVERAKLNADYSSNVYPRTVPHGFDCEAFTFDMLRRAHEQATEPYDREHVTPWIQRNMQPVSIFDNYSVDTPEDLERIRSIMQRQQAA